METLPDPGRATFPRTPVDIGQTFHIRPKQSATFPRQTEAVSNLSAGRPDSQKPFHGGPSWSGNLSAAAKVGTRSS